MRPQSYFNYQLLKDEKERSQYTSIFNKSIFDILNGGISFQDNVKASILNVTFATANVDLNISHGLGVVPTGYFCVGPSANMVLYNGISGPGAWTESSITLRSSAIGYAKVLFF